MCWSDGSGDVEQYDEMISVSPPPARSKHPSWTRTNLNNFLSFSFLSPSLSLSVSLSLFLLSLTPVPTPV